MHRNNETPCKWSKYYLVWEKFLYEKMFTVMHSRIDNILFEKLFQANKKLVYI